MKLFKRSAVIIIIAGGGLLALSLSRISDNKAVEVATGFYLKTGVRLTSEPRVDSHLLSELLTGCKEIVVCERNRRVSLLTLKANTGEVVSFTLLQWKAATTEKQELKALSETKAKEAILRLASRIEIPGDFQLDAIRLNKKDGLWVGSWKRKYRGYVFEKDLIAIQIKDVDGELFSYWKSSVGSPCPTDVVITREKASEIARKKVYSLLAGERVHLQDYVVSSPELKIVQPNAILGWLSPYHREKSRLSWVVVYTVKDCKYDLTIGSANFSEKYIMKIDAATGKIIGGSSTR